MKGIVAKPDGLYGDFHFNPKHALAEQLCWDAEHAPGNVGFSHDVEAQTSRKNGRVVVEAIRKVSSVDLVADPATTSGLFESRDAAVGHATRRAALATTRQALDTAPPPVRDMLSRIMGTADSTPNPFLPKAAGPEASRDSLTEILKRPAAPQPSLQDLLSGARRPRRIEIPSTRSWKGASDFVPPQPLPG